MEVSLPPCPREYLATGRDTSDCHNRGVETTDAATHPIVHRTATPQKNLSSPK